MKSLLLITACALVAISTMAQGTVKFLNKDDAAGINEPVYDVDKTTLVAGTDFVAQIWGGPSGTPEGSLTPQGATTVFRTGTRAGYFSNTAFERTIQGVAAGAAATLQVYAWEAKYPDLATAMANGGKFGKSIVFTVPKTGGQGPDPNVPPALPEPILGFKSFSLQIIPEPSTIALGFLGAAALMFRRRK